MLQKIQAQKILRLLFWAFLTWLLLRLFFFQGVHIPSASMQPSLIEGDYVLLNKLAFGARIPITPLSLPGTNSSYLDWIQLPYWRLPALSKVKRNDVLIFNLPQEFDLPIDQRNQYVKRCVALPGDSFKLNAGVIYINNVKQIDKIENIKPEQDSLNYNPSYFPNSGQVKWNLDYFGPLYIPKKGDSILLDNRNLILYKTCIQEHEGNLVTTKNDSVYVNNKLSKYYVFKMDYYFTLGDNRYNSIDSRYWGLLPESHLIGKASYVVLSKQKGKSFSSVH